MSQTGTLTLPDGTTMQFRLLSDAVEAPQRYASRTVPVTTTKGRRTIVCRDCKTAVTDAHPRQKYCTECRAKRDEANTFYRDVIVRRAQERDGKAQALATVAETKAEVKPEPVGKHEANVEVGKAKNGKTITCDTCSKTVVHATANQKRCSGCAEAKKNANPFYQNAILAKALVKTEGAMEAIGQQVAVEMKGDEPAKPKKAKKAKTEGKSVKQIDAEFEERDARIQAKRDAIVAEFGVDEELALELAIKAINHAEANA